MTKAEYRPPLPEVQVSTIEKEQFELMLLIARERYESERESKDTNDGPSDVL